MIQKRCSWMIVNQIFALRKQLAKGCCKTQIFNFGRPAVGKFGVEA
jgi:hypothetical protein